MIAAIGFLSSPVSMSASGMNLLVKNFFSLGFVQVVNSLLQLLVIPYVIAKTGVENFGVVAVAQVIMFYLATFTDYGFNQTGTRDVSLNRDDGAALSAIYYRVLICKGLLCITAFIIFLILTALFPFIQQHFFLYCMAFMFVPGQAFLPGWFFQGLERMQLLAVITLAGRLLFVALVFLFIKGPGDISFFIFFLGTGNLLAAIAGMIAATRIFRLVYTKVTWPQITAALKDGWHITATNLSMNIIQYGNIFILRLFTNDIVAGYYGVAEKIFFTMKQALVIFSQSAYPRVCQVAATGATQLHLFFKRVFRPFFLLIVLGSAFTALLAPYILRFFIKGEMGNSVFILRMLCLVMPVICLNIPGTLSLLALNHKKSYFTIYTSAVLLCVIANSILARLYQAAGTVIAISITEVVITGGVSLALNKIIKKDKLNFSNE